MAAALLELAESVEESRLHETAKTSAFLGREAVVFHVGLRIGEIEFGVSDVEVAAKDHGLCLLQIFEIAKKRRGPIVVDKPAV